MATPEEIRAINALFGTDYDPGDPDPAQIGCDASCTPGTCPHGLPDDWREDETTQRGTAAADGALREWIEGTVVGRG